MNSRFKLLLVLFGAVTLHLSGCKDRLEDYTQITDPAMGVTLLEKIDSNPDLSTFSTYLQRTGYDQVIASSKKYTVWAPTNQALQGLDAAIVNDSASLSAFVGNHIVHQAYYTNMPAPELRLQALNGKFVKFYSTRLEDAEIQAANQFVGNGVLHVVNKAVLPRQNVWEFLQSTSYKQKEYIQGLNYTVLDPSKAEQTGVDPLTGKPIYKPGTGLVPRNYLFDKTGDLRNEEQEYTFILLADAALDAEREKFRPFTKGATPEEEERFASVYVLKDLAIKGLHTPDNLPEFLLSEDGVKIPMDKGAIISHHYTSNGIVYVMSAADVKIEDKILPVRVEGETPAGFSRTDKTNNIAYRIRRNPETQELFNDLYVFNHKVNRFHVRYHLPDVYSTTYKVYWVAPNDVQTLPFKQRFAVNDPASEAFPETDVPLKNFEEVYVGEFTVDNLGDLNIYIVGADNGVDQINSINVDYFRLVPQLP
ncbi:fasciclin domain-containing protein [Pontibacter beigongshangensis]|uniref:fasciclin domain-containing protein n=1 Tax=Pontibacter beigongshangensis TaxID=2574733 RepID=UPI00165027CA|nr:fasciclin domain-containing protein [Pontibacter beigongshangensis]